MPEIPEALIGRFRDQKVMLFIGSGCSLDAGIPKWSDLIVSIQRRFEHHGHEVSQAVRGYIERRDFARAAKGLRDKDANLYRQVMIEQIDPTDYTGHPPTWYRYIRLLCAPVVATTNWDNIIEDETSMRRLHWKSDPQALLEQRQTNRPSVFHVHGHIQEFDTVVHTHDEYNRFNSAEGDSARQYLGRLAEAYAFLFVGYSLEDPFITDIENHLARDWNAKLEAYKLELNPTDEIRRRAREEKGLTLLGYDKERQGGHAAGIDAFFGEVCDALEIERPPLPVDLPPAVVSQPDALVQIDEPFIKTVEPPSPEAVRRYYRGSPGGWNIVVHRKAARRTVVDRVLRELERELGVALIGAGGEGKSTALRQIALERRRQGWNVYYAEEATQAALDLAFTQMRGDRRKPMLFCVDDADAAPNLVPLLRFASNRRVETSIVLSCREYQWRQRQDLGQLRQFVQEVSTGRLNDHEANEIAGLLVGSGALRDTAVDAPTLARRLRDESNDFLLAAMLYATEGRPLLAILSDVIEDISQRADGEQLLTALGLVAALEAREGRGGRRFFCSQNLFKEAFDLSNAAARQRARRLRGEVSLTPRGGRLIETRHPRIATEVARILFADDGYLEEMEILEQILSAAGRISMRNPQPGERMLLGALPDADRRKGRGAKHVRKLFEFSTRADPSQPPVWQAWALLERDAGNVERARELFGKGAEADPSHAPTWQAWALLELNLGNLAEAERLLELGFKNCGRTPELVWLEERLRNSPDKSIAARIDELLDQGALNEAKTLLLHAIFEDPDDQQLRDLRARVRALETGLSK